MMSGLDEFLDLCDADPDWSSGEEDDPFERLTGPKTEAARTAAEANVNKKLSKEKKDSSDAFQELFGKPVQLKTKTVFGSDSSNPVSAQKIPPASDPKSVNVPAVRKSEPNIRLPPATPSPRPFVPKPDDSIGIMEPFTRLRLFKTSIQLYSDEVQPIEMSLRDRNLTVPFLPLSKLATNKDKKQFWTAGVLVKRVAGIRKSAKGNDYILWEIHDLDGDFSWTVFLFGATASSDGLKLVPVGSLLDFVNPSILDDSGNGKPKLSIANTNQVRLIGTAKDFGFCGSRRKDGQNCTAAVNKFKCDVCIHHASSELKKLNGKSKSNWGKRNSFPVGPGPRSGGIGNGKPNNDGVMVSNFVGKFTGPVQDKPSLSKLQASAPAPTAINRKKFIRMELQDPSNMMKRTSTSLGNHASISFSKELNPMMDLLPKVEKVKQRKELNLDPSKTRHLTDRDREVLVKLESADSKSELPTLLVDPTAGSRNFLKYLGNVGDKKSPDGSMGSNSRNTPNRTGPLVMNRETLKNMQKALSFVKKNGPLSKPKPNAPPTRKRKFEETELEIEGSPSSSKKENSTATASKSKVPSGQTKPGNDGVEIDMSSDEFKQLLNAKSSHASLLEDLQEDEYFTKHERKEAIENKLLSTFSIPTTAVMCRDCKYVALSQSDFCKQQRHVIRVVKATKRFFQCKDCGNRTMSLDRLPKRTCTICKGSNWLAASVGKERAGPKLESEKLVIRGDEEMFLGSAGAKMFL